MRAEEELQFMADFYPELFPTRKHCLNYLFCVVGNGYEWMNGELVDTDDDVFKNRYALKETITKAYFQNEQHWIHLHNLYTKECMEIPKKYVFEWYPLSKEYSNFYLVPDDVTPDWKALWEECKAMLLEDDISF